MKRPASESYALYISNLDRLDVSMRYIDANYIKMPIKIVSVKVRSFRLKRFTIFKANNSHPYNIGR